MGFFKKAKKKEVASIFPNTETDFNHLDENGELPWGWTTHHSEFIEKTEREFNYFREKWVAVNGKDPMREYEALKSFIKYMDDLQQLCNKKGECFGLWCSDYLINPEWRVNLGLRFSELETNMDYLIGQYQQRMEKEKCIDSFNSAVSDEVILDAIRQNEGILQKDFYKLFDNPAAKEALRERLYFMAKEGKIKRVKSGNSYILTL